MVSAPGPDDVVLNVVWTGETFTYLHPFAASQVAQGDARYRFVGNSCPPEQLELMQRFADRHPGRVVEVLDVCDRLEAHGVALERVLDQRDDGPWFGLIDPDIKANAPFVADLVAHLDDGVAAVTSGTEVWSDDNLVPPDWKGVAGEHFVSRDGFVFGSPHLAVYRRDLLDATRERWGVHLYSVGPEIPDDAKAQLASMGHDYLLYDTAKLVNALVQADGHTLVHTELDQVVHIGGLTHYLFPGPYETGDDGERRPGGFIEGEDGEQVPHWVVHDIVQDRYAVTRYTAGLLKHLLDGSPPPSVAEVASPAMVAKLRLVEREVTDLVERYGTW
jgi:hypothetical protein